MRPRRETPPETLPAVASMVRGYLEDEVGAASAEYAIVLAAIVIVLIGVLASVAGGVSNAIRAPANAIGGVQ